MGSGKGNKHAGKRAYSKTFRTSKWKKLADAAKRYNHRRKKQKKDARDG